MGALATNEDRAPGDGFLVLWAGSAEISERDTQVELRRAGVRVEVAGVEELVERANQRAPDLIVLGGEPGEDPEPLAAALREKSPGSAVPVVALAPHDAAAPRPRARFGLLARLDRDVDAPTLASQLVTLLEGLSTRPPVWRMSLASGGMRALAEELADSARSGVLVARNAGAIAVQAEGATSPTALDTPASLTDAHFHERPPGRVRVVRSPARREEGGATLDGARVVIVDEDAERRARIVKRLEQAKAQVRAPGLSAQEVFASRALDPSVVVVAAPALRNSALSPLWNEARLAVAALVVLDGEALAATDASFLVSEIAELCLPEVELGRALRDKGAIAERLETLGPARWLKLLGRCSHEVTLRVFAASGRMRVDLAGGRIQGASFRPAKQDEVIDGRAAVDAFMALPFGRVLAGPPHALTALEGVSARRKPSVVGRFEPVPSAGASRRSGLVAEEVVIKRTDATQLPFGPPKKLAALAKKEPEPARSNEVPLGDLADGDEGETNSYSAETLEALRASLRSTGSEAVTAPPPTRTGKLTKAEEEGSTASPTAAPPRRRGQTGEGSVGEKTDDAAIAGPERSEPSTEIEIGESAGWQSDDSDGESTEAARSEPAPKKASEPARPREVARQSIPRPAGALPMVEHAPSARRSSSGVWFAAGLVVALGVGAWAAWRLHGEDPPPRPIGHGSSSHDAPDEADPGAASDTGEVEAIDPALPPAEPEAEQAPAAEATPVEPVEQAPAEQTPVEQAPVEDEPPSTPTLDPATTSNNAADLINEARAAADQHDYPRSEALSRRALELSPRNARAGYRLAVALFQQQRYDEALQHADEVSRWDPRDPLPHALRGDIHSRRGRFQLAARAYQRALEVEPSFGPAQRGIDRLRARGIEP